MVTSQPSASITSASTLCGGSYYDFTVQTAAQTYWALTPDSATTVFTAALQVSGSAGTSYAALGSLSSSVTSSQGPGIQFSGQLVNGSVAVQDFTSAWLLVSSAAPYSEGELDASGLSILMARCTGMAGQD